MTDTFRITKRYRVLFFLIMVICVGAIYYFKFHQFNDDSNLETKGYLYLSANFAALSFSARVSKPMKDVIFYFVLCCFSVLFPFIF